ncbi:MAG: ABC transporter ATP-binding protein [Micromonosporaceae bacterium]|nr:ABC transporter ATP-binding protein [Micromonosporaceae bacterium]
MADVNPLLRIENLRVHFPLTGWRVAARRGPVVHAVDGVSLTVARGESVGLIGESGSGKSTLSRAVMGVYRPTSGRVLFDGIDVHRAKGSAERQIRRRMQMVFQNPYASVNRRYTVTQIIQEPMKVQKLGDAAERERRTRELLDLVGLSSRLAYRYPHELSGGQLQRVAIARALSTRPDFLIADEPTAALDVSVRAQVMNLLVDLKQELNFSLLFISHDLATVSYIADRVAVLYLGRLVEVASIDDLERDPRHPYTEALLAAVPRPDPDAARLYRAPGGEIPSAVNPPSGCHYHPRCPLAEERCRQEYPPISVLSGNRRLACHVRAGDRPAPRLGAGAGDEPPVPYIDPSN